MCIITKFITIYRPLPDWDCNKLSTFSFLDCQLFLSNLKPALLTIDKNCSDSIGSVQMKKVACMNKSSEKQIFPLKQGVYLCFQKSILYIYEVWQIRHFFYWTMLPSCFFGLWMFVSFRSTVFTLGLVKEELDLYSLMASSVSPLLLEKETGLQPFFPVVTYS